MSNYIEELYYFWKWTHPILQAGLFLQVLAVPISLLAMIPVMAGVASVSTLFSILGCVLYLYGCVVSRNYILFWMMAVLYTLIWIIL